MIFEWWNSVICKISLVQKLLKWLGISGVYAFCSALYGIKIYHCDTTLCYMILPWLLWFWMFTVIKSDGFLTSSLVIKLLEFMLCTSVEIFFSWLANTSPSWAAYRVFMSGFWIAFDKHPGVHPILVGETWRKRFDKCVLRVTVPEATNACQYDHIFTRLKAVIRGAVHRVQAIWDTKLTMEYWVFLLVDAKNALN